MLNLRHLKATILIVGVLVVNLGLIAAFQVQEADAQGRIRQWTVTYTTSQQVDTRSKTVWARHNRCGTRVRGTEYTPIYATFEVTVHYLDDGSHIYSEPGTSRELPGTRRAGGSYTQYEHCGKCYYNV